MNGLQAYLRQEIMTAYSMLDSVRETRCDLTSRADIRKSHSHEAQWLAVINTLQGVQDYITRELPEGGAKC
jgi:hypothetical protein